VFEIPEKQDNNKKRRNEEENVEIPHTKASGRDIRKRYGTSHASVSPATTSHQPSTSTRHTCKPKWI
jgi:hypothetical protein